MADAIFFDRNEAEFLEYDTPKEKCVSGQPKQRLWNHFTTADEKFYTGIWEAEPGRWKIDYTENEFCQILAGHSILHRENGDSLELRAGDNFVIPAGFVGEWEVVETTRKIYAIYEP